MKKTLLFFAVLLLCASPGLAQNTSQALSDIMVDPANLFGTSITFENSFGLFYESFDYAAMNPADLALISGDEAPRYLGRPSTREGKAHILYTNLSNFGDANALQAAGVFAAGSGNVVFGVGFLQNNVMSASTFQSLLDNSGNRWSNKDDFETQFYMIGYGWKIGDAGYLGFDYSYADLDSPFTSTFQVLPSGPATTTFRSDFQSTVQTLRVAWRSDVSDRTSYNIVGNYTSHDVTDLEHDGDSFRGFDLGGSYWGLHGRVDLYRGDYDVEIYGGLQSGSFDPDNSVIQNDPDDVWDFEYDKIVSANFDHDLVYGGVHYMRRMGRTDLGAGLSIWDHSYDLDMVWDVSDPGPPPGAPFERRQDVRNQSMTSIMLPLAVRVHVNERLSATFGAVFDYMQADNDTKFITANVPGNMPEFRNLSSSENSNDWTSTDYRFGMRYEATDNITAQVLFGSGTTTVAGRGTVRLDRGAFSVALHW